MNPLHRTTWTGLALAWAACGGRQPGTTGDAAADDSALDGPGSATDDAPTADQRLYPFEVGRSWTSSASTTYEGTTTPATVTVTVTGMGTYDGRNAYVTQAAWSDAPVFTSYTEIQSADDSWGMVPVEGQPDVWVPYTKGPVVDGASWTYSYSGTRTQTWHDAGSVTVAAGTFSSCWRIDYVVAESSQPGDVNYGILCRGVGTVKTEQYVSSTGFTSHSQLVSKSF